MVFYSKCAILLCCLLVDKCVVGFYVKDNNSKAKQNKRTTRDEIIDITKSLTDAEIETALSDLTLSDLTELNKLIDSPNNDGADGINGFLDSNQRPVALYDIENYLNENVDFDDNELQAVYSNALNIPREAFEDVNIRAKRQEVKTENTVDEEYLKLLENSFPRDVEQSDMRGQDSEIKKDHIRVKRY